MTPATITHLFFDSVAIAVVAVVYLKILPNEEPFSHWFSLGNHLLFWDRKAREMRNVPRWWWKPVFYCEKCFAGQVALWGYVISRMKLISGKAAILDYHPTHHALLICLSVLVTVILTRLFTLFLNKTQ